MNNYGETLQAVQDATRDRFAAITTITAIDPISVNDSIAANAVLFDLLAPVANHIYFLQNLLLIETVAITGNPTVRIYDITPTVNIMFGINLGSVFNGRDIWCTRLEHAPAGASAGAYSINYNGFDLTYT